MSTPAELLPWAAAAVQAGLGLYFLGKAKGMLDAVSARVAALEAGRAHGEARREALAANVQKTREELAAFRGAAEAQHLSMAEAMAAVQRDLQGVTRQLAGLAAERLGWRADATAALLRRRSAQP
jgi:hypothetical protein